MIIDVGDELSEVGRVQEELSGFWQSHQLPEDVEADVSLALEEILSNVLRHSRREGRSAEIRVAFTVDAAGFQFEVSDCSPPFDPLSRTDPDVSLALEERQPGGLGIFIVKQLADEVSYARRDGRNCLRFRKLFPHSDKRAQ